MDRGTRIDRGERVGMRKRQVGLGTRHGRGR